MSLKPITCKHCQKVIQPSPYIIGEPEPIRMAKTVQKMAKHIDARAQEEEAAGIASANGNPFKAGPHHAAVIRLQQAVQGISELSIVGNFNLSEDLERAVHIGRQALHNETRTVRMTDEELQAKYETWKNGADKWPTALAFLQDLRDRYEGLGKYATVSASSPAQTAPADSAKPAVSGTARKA